MIKEIILNEVSCKKDKKWRRMNEWNIQIKWKSLKFKILTLVLINFELYFDLFFKNSEIKKFWN